MIDGGLKIVNLRIPVLKSYMYGVLAKPSSCKGVVILCMGSRVNRHKIHNTYLQKRLIESGYACLSMDLLSPIEEECYDKRFNLGLNSDRLLSVVQWLRDFELTEGLPISIVGLDNGALIALEASLKSENAFLNMVFRNEDILDIVIEKGDIKLPKAMAIFNLDRESEIILKLEGKEKINISLTFIPETTTSFEEDNSFVEEIVQFLS